MNVQMPGMLYAANAQNEERMLQTFGMLAVELRGDSGEDLNIAEGSSAEIKVPLDASLIGTAPITIPLWYFDEANGYWIEEGQATLVGNAYIGTVTHFSFWNCDIPAEAVNLCVTVSDEANNLLSNLLVKITSNTYGTGSGYTNENGEVCGLVPRNESLALNVYMPEICNGDSIHFETVGPFTNDSSINIMINSSPELFTETVIGVFNDCNGDPITDGYVNLGYASQIYTDFVSNGDFEINLTRCVSEGMFSIEGVDFLNLQSTDSINYTFTSPITNIGNISSCNTIDEFISYQVGDDPNVLYTENLFAQINELQQSLEIVFDGEIDGFPTDNYFELQIGPFNGAGTYTTGSINFIDYNNSTTLESPFIGTFNVTTVGDVDEYIDINFTGIIDDYQTPNQIPMSGTIHVLRDE